MLIFIGQISFNSKAFLFVYKVSEDSKEVFLCDMGIAKVKQLGAMTITSLSKGCGTYPYMAPEMFKKSRRGTEVDICQILATSPKFYRICVQAYVTLSQVSVLTVRMH